MSNSEVEILRMTTEVAVPTAIQIQAYRSSKRSHTICVNVDRVDARRNDIMNTLHEETARVMEFYQIESSTHGAAEYTGGINLQSLNNWLKLIIGSDSGRIEEASYPRKRGRAQESVPLSDHVHYFEFSQNGAIILLDVFD